MTMDCPRTTEIDGVTYTVQAWEEVGDQTRFYLTDEAEGDLMADGCNHTETTRRHCPMKRLRVLVLISATLTLMASSAGAATYRNDSSSDVRVKVGGTIHRWSAGETRGISGYVVHPSLTKISDDPYAVSNSTTLTISSGGTWSSPIGPAASETVFRARGTFTATLTIQELPHGEDPATSTAWRDVYEAGSSITMTAADTKIVADKSGTFYRIGCKTGEYTTGTITVEVSVD